MREYRRTHKSPELAEKRKEYMRQYWERKAQEQNQRILSAEEMLKNINDLKAQIESLQKGDIECQEK